MSDALAQVSIPESRILAEQNRQLYGSLASVLGISTIAALLLALSHGSIRPASVVAWWLLAFVLVSAARAGLMIAFHRAGNAETRPGRWYRRFSLLTALSGAVWGASAWTFFAEDSHNHQALLAFLVAGLGAAGVVNQSARWQCAWMFLLPALVPFMVRFWLLDSDFAHLTAALIALFIAALLTMSVQLSRRNRERIVSRMALARQYEESQRQRERFRSLVESTTAILWDGDPETFRFHYVSPEAEQLLGYPTSRWTEEPDFWQAHIHPDDRDAAIRFCKEATRAKRKHTFDYRMLASDGRVVWLRDVVNVVVENNRATRLVGVMIDISELKETQQDLEYVSGLQRLLVATSRRLFEALPEELDDVFNETLERIGRWCDVDRAYLIRFTADLSHYSNTHEWVADGITAEMANLQNVPSTTIPRLIERMKRKQRTAIPRVAELAEEWAAEKALFEEEDIRSLISLPIFIGDRLAGLIGFDSVRRVRDWGDQEAALLQALGDLIGMATERMETDRQLRASEALRDHAESLAGMGSWEWEIGSETFRASDEWRNVTGCGDGPLSREQVLALTPETEREDVVAALQRSVETGESYNIEHRIVRPDNGEERWLAVHAEVVQRADGARTMRGFAQDITDRKAAEKKLYRLAHYDSLSGLPNRVLVLDRLQQALKRARRHQGQVAVLFVDLDQFKKVNDTLGHEAGDTALVDAAKRLSGLFRDDDTVSRIGGDEFVVVLDRIEAVTDVTASASRVLEAFRHPLVVSSREFLLTASIGIAVAPHDGATAQDLMRNADTAMYHAKQKGRDAYQFFTRSMNEAVERQLALEEALRGALERGELHVAYQPLVRMADRSCVGAEALLRWEHPELGSVPPDEFIPVAEQSGQIEALGRFVIGDVVARTARWRTRYAPDFCVSFNVSPRQFRDAGIADAVAAELDRHGVDGAGLEIEVTEGLLLPERREVDVELEALRGRGVGLVMDDFGTGYASLRYLRDHPFTSLKIDRDFIRGVDVDDRNRQLVVSAIRLGQALGMKVVAEGVETEDELAVVAAEGCELVQGFLVGRPMPPDRLEQRLREQSADG